MHEEDKTYADALKSSILSKFQAMISFSNDLLTFIL